METSNARAREGRRCPAAAGSDSRNQRLLEAVNARGPVFLSHTKLAGDYVLRVAVGNIRTTEEHLRTAWRLLREEAGRR
jgi:aromatic-L-amino-acid decarboxylase